MAHKIYFTPIPSEPYFTFDEHVRKAVRNKYGSISYNKNTSGPILDLIKEKLCSLLALDPFFDLQIIRPSRWVELLSKTLKVQAPPQFINADYWKAQCSTQHPSVVSRQASKQEVEYSTFDLVGSADPLSGSIITSDELENTVERPQVLDITFSFPIIPEFPDQAELVVLQTNAALGLPFSLMIVLSHKKHSLSELSITSFKSDISYFEVSILQQILNDYVVKGVTQIKREIRYKEAVINQAIQQARSFSLSVPLKASRSANLIKVQFDDPNSDVVKILNEKGYVLTDSISPAGEKTMLIGNYPTHSKEQMEILADELVGLE